MACDVQTLENLLVADGFLALSDRDFLISLAGAFLSVSGIDAQTAVTNAAANGYQKLSDLQLDQALLAVFTASAYDAQTIVNTIATQGTDALDRRDLLLAQIAAFCAGSMTTAASIQALLCANGYLAFSNFDALRALLAVCTSSSQVGALDWSARVVQNGGPVPSAATSTAISTFLTSISTIRTKIKHLNVIAPDSIIAMRTPLIADYGYSVWVPHTIGAGFAETVGANGWRGYADASNGIVYDTGVLCSLIPTFNVGNGGISAVCPDNPPAVNNSILTGSANGVTSGGIGFAINYTGGLIKAGVWTTTALISIATVGGAFYSVNRNAANDLNWSWGNSSTPYAKTATLATVNSTAPEATLTIAAGGGNTTAGYVLAPQSLSFMAVHDALTVAEGTILFNAVKALRTSFGGGFV